MSLRKVRLVCWLGIVLGAANAGIAAVSLKTSLELYSGLDELVRTVAAEDSLSKFVKLLPEREGKLMAEMLQTRATMVSESAAFLQRVGEHNQRADRADIRFGVVVVVLFGLVMWLTRKNAADPGAID
jgi:hypothetical protein